MKCNPPVNVSGPCYSCVQLKIMSKDSIRQYGRPSILVGDSTTFYIKRTVSSIIMAIPTIEYRQMAFVGVLLSFVMLAGVHMLIGLSAGALAL